MPDPVTQLARIEPMPPHQPKPLQLDSEPTAPQQEIPETGTFKELLRYSNRQSGLRPPGWVHLKEYHGHDHEVSVRNKH